MSQDLASQDLASQDLASQNLDPLILDLLEWIAREPRSYADVLDAWRTSCPRLTVWEDAIDRGFAAREHRQGHEVLIRLTATGRDFLRKHGRIVNLIPPKHAAGAFVTPMRPYRCAA